MPTRNNQSVIWISKDATFPDVCITCGMFTDRRVKVKHTVMLTKMVEANDTGSSGLGCLLFLLGPIGMIVSIILALTSSRTPKSNMVAKNKTIKLKTQVPQCVMCQSEEKAKARKSDVESGALAFLVHKKFAQSYHAINPAVIHPLGFEENDGP